MQRPNAFAAAQFKASTTAGAPPRGPSLMTQPQVSACCGSAVVLVDFCGVCEDCGRQLDEPELVSLPPLPSERETASSVNHVPALCDGADLLVTSASGRKRARRLCSTMSSLEAQVASKAAELRMPDAVPRSISELVRSELWGATSSTACADPAVAVAVLLYVGARLSRFPVTLRGVCAGCNVPTHAATRLFARVCRGLAQPLPAPSVRPAPRAPQPLAVLRKRIPCLQVSSIAWIPDGAGRCCEAQPVAAQHWR